MNPIVYRIQALTVPDNLPHRDRKDEIEELVQYLRVNATSGGEVYLLNVGAAEPGPDLAGAPWLKKLTSGFPQGLKILHDGEWIPADPNTIRHEEADWPALQYGEFKVTVNHGWQSITPVFTFARVFDTIPNLVCTVINDTKSDFPLQWFAVPFTNVIHLGVVNGGSGGAAAPTPAHSAPTAADHDGRELTFNFQAIGPIAP